MDNQSYKYSIFCSVGALLLWGISYSTISSSVPQIYAPGAFTVVIPVLMLKQFFDNWMIAVLVGTSLVPILFFLWCLPLFKGQKAVPKRSLVFVIIFLLLSIIQLAGCWSGGIKYQGIIHTITIYIFNIIFWIALFILFRANKNQSSYSTNFLFHWIFFAWFGWLAFPWLGELI